MTVLPYSLMGVYVPSDSLLWRHLLFDAYNMGNEGVQKTLHRLRASFHVPLMRKLVLYKSLFGATWCVSAQQNAKMHWQS
jgi:hypothetical protein